MGWRDVKYYSEDEYPELFEPMTQLAFDILDIPPGERTLEEQALLEKETELNRAKWERRQEG